MDVIAFDLGILEGPVNCQDGTLIVTTLDTGRVYRITDGAVSVLADLGGGANGAAEGPNGMIYVAQNGGKGPAIGFCPAGAGIQTIAPSGKIEHLWPQMTAPNDLCFGPDGLLYVTDPSRNPERDDGRIWRCDVETRQCELLLTCDWYPNGIAFSSDDAWLYVADTRHGRIVRFPLADVRSETLEISVMLDHGVPDGFAFDVEDRLLVACPNFTGPGDVQVYSDGALVQVLAPSASGLFTNLSISAAGDLYLCDATMGQVLKQRWAAAGLPLHPFRSRAEAAQ